MKMGLKMYLAIFMKRFLSNFKIVKWTQNAGRIIFILNHYLFAINKLPMNDALPIG